MVGGRRLPRNTALDDADPHYTFRCWRAVPACGDSHAGCRIVATQSDEKSLKLAPSARSTKLSFVASLAFLGVSLLFVVVALAFIAASIRDNGVAATVGEYWPPVMVGLVLAVLGGGRYARLRQRLKERKRPSRG